MEKHAWVHDEFLLWFEPLNGFASNLELVLYKQLLGRLLHLLHINRL